MWIISHATEVLLYLYATDKFIEALPIPPNSVFEALGHLLKPVGNLIKKAYLATQPPAK